MGISLSELASALPNSGGQYFWANELAPKKYANFASYLTGWFAWAGSVFTSASVALATSSACVGCYQLMHPDLYVESGGLLLKMSVDRGGQHDSSLACLRWLFGHQLLCIHLELLCQMAAVDCQYLPHDNPTFVPDHSHHGAGKG